MRKKGREHAALRNEGSIKGLQLNSIDKKQQDQLSSLFTAIASGDEQKVATVIDLARSTWPEERSMIDAINDQWKITLAARRAAEAEAESARALGIRLEQELAASGARSDEAAARARSEAEERVAGLRGERTALVAEAERLGKALAEAGAAGAAEVAQARRAHEQEMQVVEVRVRLDWKPMERET